jgi:protein-disulfide isomerase
MRSSGLTGTLSTGVLVVCAVVVTGVVVRREFSSPVAPDAGVSVPFVEDWQSFALTGQRIGPATAAVTIVEFSDFQCPFCRISAERLANLRAEFPTTVAVVYRHFPLKSHLHAAAAAVAAECAGEQGKFWEMHGVLFGRQAELGEISWLDLADQAGISDLSLFRSCLDEQSGIAAVKRDSADGERLGVRGTPTLLVNGRRIQGVPPSDSLRAYVIEALAAGGINHPASAIR